jgi:hypothetical protein
LAVYGRVMAGEPRTGAGKVPMIRYKRLGRALPHRHRAPEKRAAAALRPPALPRPPKVGARNPPIVLATKRRNSPSIVPLCTWKLTVVRKCVPEVLNVLHQPSTNASHEKHC